jgi:hypothetical protein
MIDMIDRDEDAGCVAGLENGPLAWSLQQRCQGVALVVCHLNA